MLNLLLCSVILRLNVENICVPAYISCSGGGGGDRHHHQLADVQI